MSEAKIDRYRLVAKAKAIFELEGGRLGAAHWEALYLIDKDRAREIDQSPLDPYVHDDRIPAFLNAVCGPEQKP